MSDTVFDRGARVMDPVTFEVIRNALVAATDEMVLTLRRAAYSTNIKTRADFSCAFFDAELRSIAQGFAQPVHLGSMVQQVPNAVRRYGAENIGPGDTIVTNDPFPGGVHLNDVMLVSPVHWESELVGWVANLAHHVDVGGGAPASVGAFREVFQEGIIIPPVKVVEAGALVQDVWKLVLAQIRSKHETGGDLRAQVAANATGIRRVGSVIERYGLDTVREAIDELVEYTDRRTRAELERLPHGTYEAEGYVDFDGYSDERVRLHARIELRPDGVRFDVTDSEPQRRAPVNSTYAQTYSACAYAVKCLIDPDLPVNDGFYRLLQVDTRPGTIADCEWPAPVVGGWETQTRLVEVIFRALSDALPGGVPAGTKGMMCHAGFGAVDPELGYWCFLETFGGGYGGRIASDGPDAVQAHGQNTENAPVEETERGYPVRVERLELVEDSEGAGRFRGGLGLRKDYRFPRGPVTFTVLADRDKEGPWGIFGGLAGKPAEYVHVSDGEERAIGSKATVEVNAGDVVSYRTCGGGGYGPPHGRDPELVLRDVVEGKVSAERARSVYGVAIDVSARRVDEDETRRLRS